MDEDLLWTMAMRAAKSVGVKWTVEGFDVNGQAMVMLHGCSLVQGRFLSGECGRGETVAHALNDALKVYSGRTIEKPDGTRVVFPVVLWATRNANKPRSESDSSEIG